MEIVLFRLSSSRRITFHVLVYYHGTESVLDRILDGWTATWNLRVLLLVAGERISAR